LKKESEKIFKQLGKRSETDNAVFNIISRYYIHSDQFDIAKLITEQILKVSPDISDIHYLAGVAYDKTDEKTKALNHFEKVFPDSKFYLNSVVNISFIYLRQGNTEKAIDYMEEIVKKMPDNPMLLLYLGSFYEEAKKFEKAEYVLNQGIEIDPDNPGLNFRLGVVYDKMNKKEESIEKMKKVLIVEPKNAEALNYLGYTYADLNINLDEAEILIKKALKYKPDDGYIIDSLGWVYFKKGLYQKALPLLIKAASINPDDPLILEHLGDAYLMTSDKNKALETYRKSLLKKKEDRSELEKKILELKKEKAIK
jgi:tetratricopeptide (TPR) repeat protein